jgi:hypothetical protein
MSSSGIMMMMLMRTRVQTTPQIGKSVKNNNLSKL